MNTIFFSWDICDQPLYFSEESLSLVFLPFYFLIWNLNIELGNNFCYITFYTITLSLSSTEYAASTLLSTLYLPVLPYLNNNLSIRFTFLLLQYCCCYGQFQQHKINLDCISPTLILSDTTGIMFQWCFCYSLSNCYQISICNIIISPFVWLFAC